MEVLEIYQWTPSPTLQREGPPIEPLLLYNTNNTPRIIQPIAEHHMNIHPIRESHVTIARSHMIILPIRELQEMLQPIAEALMIIQPIAWIDHVIIQPIAAWKEEIQLLG